MFFRILCIHMIWWHQNRGTLVLVAGHGSRVLHGHISPPRGLGVCGLLTEDWGCGVSGLIVTQPRVNPAFVRCNNSHHFPIRSPLPICPFLFRPLSLNGCCGEVIRRVLLLVQELVLSEWTWTNSSLCGNQTHLTLNLLQIVHRACTTSLYFNA